MVVSYHPYQASCFSYARTRRWLDRYHPAELMELEVELRVAYSPCCNSPSRRGRARRLWHWHRPLAARTCGEPRDKSTAGAVSTTAAGTARLAPVHLPRPGAAAATRMHRRKRSSLQTPVLLTSFIWLTSLLDPDAPAVLILAGKPRPQPGQATCGAHQVLGKLCPYRVRRATRGLV